MYIIHVQCTDPPDELATPIQGTAVRAECDNVCDQIPEALPFGIRSCMLVIMRTVKVLTELAFWGVTSLDNLDAGSTGE